MKKTFLYIFAVCFVAVGSFTLMSFGDAAQTDEQKITAAVDAMKVAYLAEADVKCKAAALAEAQATWDAEVAAKASATPTAEPHKTGHTTKKPVTEKAKEAKELNSKYGPTKEEKAAAEKAAKEKSKEAKELNKKYN